MSAEESADVPFQMHRTCQIKNAVKTVVQLIQMDSS